MIFGNLKLINFKNYGTCSLDFSPRINFIYGDNGNGKNDADEVTEEISFC